MLLGWLSLFEFRSVGFEDLAVVSKLFLADTLPAVVAEPGFDTAAASERNVGVVPMVSAVVGGILLEAATITMKRLVAAWTLAVAEFVSVLRIT